MARVLDDAEMAAWLGRLSGGLWSPPTGGADGGVPAWFGTEVIRLDGHHGMLQLSNFGAMRSDDPDAFEAALLRRSIGMTMLYSTLETAHTVSYDGATLEDEDIIIIGMVSQGGQRLHTAAGVQSMVVGRMGFMSSLGPSAVEQLGVTDTTGVVVPAAAVAGYRHVLARGADIFPDTPLTRAAGASLARMLFEWAQDPDQGVGALAGTEAALLAMVRGLFRQFPGDGEMDRASELRAEAGRIIERRHRDASFGIEDLAVELHVSRRQLFRLYAGTDESLAARLLRRRLITAREELLSVPPQDLSAVAERSGFSDAAALRAQFSRHVGHSPSAFRLAARSRPARLAEAMLLSDEQQGPSV
ncbi:MULTISPECIES: AraC family transcriptional regulator [Microbacterium]|uniref:AraC family transcriptional regulator n=1 Tax=Microbacterium TaxID=33882 RepID=UPI00099FD650|nr:MULTISPECIES: AraC family transcriptional regulator [Microbacterium]